MTVEVLGLLLAVLIGVSLGLLGGGGSILAVPILVYAVGMAAKPAIATSLLVVGATSFIGALRHWREANVDVRTAVVFGAVSMIGSYAGGRLAARVSDTFQLLLFTAVMFAAAVAMFRSRGEDVPRAARLRLVVASAAGVGLLTGIVGVGGGFLIVPALVLFSGVPMKRAAGTSLVVIAMNSATGFLAYAGTVPIDWKFTLLFTLLAIVGVVIGSAFVKRVPQIVLKRAFAGFIAAVGVLIVVQNVERIAETRDAHHPQQRNDGTRLSR